MHHEATAHGSMSFFQSLSHRLGADPLDQAQSHHLVAEHPQRPVASAARRVAARQLDQPLFDVAAKLDRVRSRRLGPRRDRGVEALGDEPLANAGDRPQTASQGVGNLLIGPARLGNRVGQQQDTSVDQFAGGGLAGRNEPFQRGPFLFREGDAKLVPDSLPVRRTHHDGHGMSPGKQPVNRRLTAH